MNVCALNQIMYKITFLKELILYSLYYCQAFYSKLYFKLKLLANAKNV